MTDHLTSIRSITARDIMTTDVQSFSPQTPIPNAIHQLLLRHFSEMPIITEKGEYCGMFSETCCMRILATLGDLVKEPGDAKVNASELMVPRSRLMVLRPDDDVFVAISSLLSKGYSGAPVIGDREEFLGIFSEHSCLGFVIEAVYSSLPTAVVQNFVDSGGNRLIDEETDIYAIAEIFNDFSYDRLPVIADSKIVGQVSRRDVLMHSGILASILKQHLGDDTLDVMSAKLESAHSLNIPDTLANHTVMDYADEFSHTIEPDQNLFSIAQSFFDSPHRHFPVLDGQNLIGVVNRSDVLNAAIKLLSTIPDRPVS